MPLDTTRATIEPLEARIAPAATVLAVAHALDLADGISVSVTGNPAAVATQTLGTTGQLLGFPSGGDGDFLILSTGIATHVTTVQNSGDSQGTDFGVPGEIDDEVSVLFTLPVPVVSGTQRLKLDFMFLTEEYPEYVGAGFNDTFQVLINGENFAKDEFGNPIDVDTAFFQGVSAPGTLFDGRTSKLTLSYTIPDGVTSLDIELRLTDVGDGVLDSAVLVDNVRFESPQVVFLDFDGASIADHFGVGVTALIPGFSAADIGSGDDIASLIAQLVSQVQAMYAAYDIEFTTSAPAGGDYTTIIIGGDNNILLDISGASALTKADFPSTSVTLRDFYGLGTNSLLGLAGGPDIGNRERNDSAVIFSGEFDDFFSADPVADRIAHLAVTIAHELGHNLGLRHVQDDNFSDIMRQNAPRDTGAIFGTTLVDLAEQWNDGATKQNDDAYLTSILGKSGGSSVTVAFADTESSFSSTSGTTLYNVTISFEAPDNDGAPIVLHFDKFDGTQNLKLPSLPAGTTFTLTAASTLGGPIDVFSGAATGGSLDSSASSVLLFDSDNALATIPLSIFDGVKFKAYGSLPLKSNDLGNITIASKNVVKLTDSDGDIYTIKLTGPGMFGYLLDDPDADGTGSLLGLTLDDTTVASKLTITVKRAGGGDGFVSIGEITGTLGAALKSLDAPKADITGGGINFPGSLGSLKIHNLSPGANIYTGVAADIVSSLKINTIGDGSNIAIGTDIASFTAVNFGESSFAAPSVKSFLLTGSKKANLDATFAGVADIVGQLGKFSAGDFLGTGRITAGGLFFDSTALAFHEVFDGAVIDLGSAVTSLNAARIGNAQFVADSFGKVIVSGDKSVGIQGNVGADFTATGGFLQLRAHDILSTASIVAGGLSSQETVLQVHEIQDGAEISIESTITKFTAAHVGAATIHAAAVQVLNVTGDSKAGLAGDFSAALSLTLGDSTFDNTLASATIAGALNGAELVLDSIGKLTAKAIVDSSIFAGFNPADAGDPLGGGVFFDTGLINSLKLTSAIDAIVNSMIAAKAIKTLNFKSVASDNGGIRFGVISDERVGKVSIPGFNYSKSGPADQALGDFHIILA